MRWFFFLSNGSLLSSYLAIAVGAAFSAAPPTATMTTTTMVRGTPSIRAHDEVLETAGGAPFRPTTVCSWRRVRHRAKSETIRSATTSPRRYGNIVFAVFLTDDGNGIKRVVERNNGQEKRYEIRRYTKTEKCQRR